MRRRLAEYLTERGLMGSCDMDGRALEQLTYEIEKTYLAEYLAGMVTEIEDVMSISPLLGWRDILGTGVRKIVEALRADAGTIRLFEPETGHMVSFGSYRFSEKERKHRVPTAASISGTVARSGKSYVVPNILEEPLYRDKEAVTAMNLNSLIAVPIVIPPFIEAETEIRGTLQIYYKENNRHFDPLDITHAEILARRISHVVARKRIIDLSQLNLHKERLVEKIFLKLSKREGIKMRELFGIMAPELVDIIQIQGCSLYSVSEDRSTVRLEMNYPEMPGTADAERTIPVEDFPYMSLLVAGPLAAADTETDKVSPSYILIRDPERSRLSNPQLASLMRSYGSRSMLAVPLSPAGTVRFFLVFFAAEREEEFAERDIELLTFFGKEVMKALRIERLDDLLHDFKNPVVAMGGFSRRLAKLLDTEDLDAARPKMREIVDVIVEEAARMERVMRSGAVEGRERPVDAGKVLERRVLLNAEAVERELGAGVDAREVDVEPELKIWCVPHELERAIDNLLLNAREAVPPGGRIRASCRRAGAEVNIEIRNTGAVEDEVLDQLRAGSVVGRGLGIVHRFVRDTRGRLEVDAEEGETVFSMRVPLYRRSGKA